VSAATLAELEAQVVVCRRCPRLVAWREQVARERRAAYADEEYWGAPLPGFGDPAARVLDWLFAALHRAGFANQPTSTHRGDGLALRDAWIAAAVRCAPPANRPTPEERDTCLPWSVRELELLPHARLIVCLGGFAWDAALRLRAAAGLANPRPRPRFGHDVLFDAGDRLPLLGCFHPSQQNTFTGRLTEPMMDAVLERARGLVGGSPD
jgi:uracil-DNA glycosylase